MRRSVLIIGAGLMGALYDGPGDGKVLSHAHAFASSPDHRLLGFIDSDAQKARQACGIWGGKPYADVHEAPKADIYSIAVPDRLHYEVLTETLKRDPSLILLEKPVATSHDELDSLRLMARQVRTPILVNHGRRFIEYYSYLRGKVVNGEYGQFIHGTGYYGKGILHNGSHMVDLLFYLFGRDVGAAASWPKREAADDGALIGIEGILWGMDDHSPDDPSVAALLGVAGGRFALIPVDSGKVTIFEMDLLFEKKRVKLLDGGMKAEEYDLNESSAYFGHRNYVRSSGTEMDLSESLNGAVRNITAHLDGDAPLLCPILDGMRTLETCLRIKDAYHGLGLGAPD
ncbi:MAG: Gfo/Idh/MocA family oxidoreductase [Oscillospiraceae bacterium]|nr:Gfo/Idh/MocA family oxidoreductase [Oscillospiraceae bacterium]